MTEEDVEIYVCQCCGLEDHPDAFGTHCRKCDIDLSEFDEPSAAEAGR